MSLLTQFYPGPGGGGGATATVPASLDIVSFYPPSRRSPNGIMYVVGTTSGGVDNFYAGSSPADLKFVAAAAAGVGNYVDLVEASNGIVWGGNAGSTLAGGALSGSVVIPSTGSSVSSANTRGTIGTNTIGEGALSTTGLGQVYGSYGNVDTGAASGVFRRIEDGSTAFVNIGPNFLSFEISEVFITSGNEAIFWLANGSGTQTRYRSTDGTTFTSAPFTTPSSTNYCPSQVAQFSNGDLYAIQYGTRGNSGGSATDLYSTDLGVTWTSPAVLPGGTGQNVDLININGTVYVAKSSNRGVWSSTDGATWTPIYSPIACTSLFELGGNLWGCNGTSFVQLTSS